MKLIDYADMLNKEENYKEFSRAIVDHRRVVEIGCPEFVIVTALVEWVTGTRYTDNARSYWLGLLVAAGHAK